MTIAAPPILPPTRDTSPRPQLLRFRFSVTAYHQLISEGLIEEGAPYELLEGQIVHKDRSKAGEDPMTVGFAHAWVVKKLAKLGAKLDPSRCHMQTQQPISLATDGEPEPDAAIIAGSEDDYRDRLPTAANATCVIEVADSSLEVDRTLKQRLYAEAGIKQYVIINLVDRCIEVHTDPQPANRTYASRVVMTGDAKVEFLAPDGQTLSIAVASLLP